MQVKCIIGQHDYNALAKHWCFCTCIEYVSGLNVIHRGGYCCSKYENVRFAQLGLN